MEQLESAKLALKNIDRDLALLFEKRLAAARDVALAQRALAIPAAEPFSPDAIIEENSPLFADEELRSYYPLFLNHLMGLSSQVEHRVMSGIRVAYAGTEGAFAHIAARKIFSNGTHIPYPDFRLAYEAVENGECDCAVLPIENSYAGDVAQVMDLSYFGSLYINGVYDIRVTQCLLGTQDATRESIKEVISHPQALSQCAEYLAKLGVQVSEASNTAIAARKVAETASPALAAIGSPEAAELYGLKILETNINESAVNTTRFAVFTRTPNRVTNNDSCFIMTFTVKNEAGALAKAISILGERGFNMRSLKSRPNKNLSWNYYFYIEAEGNLASPAGIRMLDKLGTICSGLKILASYEREIPL